MLKLVGIAPHPPIIIPDIGGGELRKATKTVAGMRDLSRKLKEAGPELLILITPHGQVLREGPAVLASEQLEGSFARFGFPQIRINFKTDPELLSLLQQETEEEDVKPVFLGGTSQDYRGLTELDHGAMVPLYYLQQAGFDKPGLHLTFGYNSYRELCYFGSALRRAADRRGLPYAVLASGDLSHRLVPGAPAGYSRRGLEFDQLLVERLKQGQVEEILNFDPQLVEEAGECGLRSFIIAIGIFAGAPFKSDIISYEGPFGVGYLVATLEPLSTEKVNPVNGLVAGNSPVKESERESFNPAHLAREALSSYLTRGKKLTIPEDLPLQYRQKAGAFVSLKKGGALRGCIGTVEPAEPSLAEEIARNALSAALRDPRFPPVTQAELDELSISVDVLSPLEPISGKAELNPQKYGVLVRSGSKSGLLLPDLEGVDTVEQQLEIASRKAGIGPGEKVELFRFVVTRYKEG